MHREHLLFLLSGLGIVLPACAKPSEDIAQNANALTDDPIVTEYLATKAYAALTAPVALEVKNALMAAPGATSRATMVDLFKAPKFLMLGSASASISCKLSGEEAQLGILSWVKQSAAVAGFETVAETDQRNAVNMVAMRSALAGVDVRNISATLATLAEKLATAKPAFALPKDSCGSPSTTNTTGSSSGGSSGSSSGGSSSGGGSTTVNTGSSSGGSSGNSSCNSTTTANDNCNSDKTTHASLDPQEPRAGEASVILADMFAGVAAEAPSRALSLEWSALRSRYQAGIAKARSSAAVRDELRHARRAGSATLGRQDALAIAKFDQGAALVDQFARTGVRFAAPAMNVVHAVVASRDPGALRGAGHDVRCGADESRVYLPGAEVEAAVAQLFTDVQRDLASGSETPFVASTFDQKLISIHPYGDANGRTTRLMTDWLLTRTGYPPMIVVGGDTPTALFAQKSREATTDRDAHFDRLTTGMRRTVALLEAAVGRA